MVQALAYPSLTPNHTLPHASFKGIAFTKLPTGAPSPPTRCGLGSLTKKELWTSFCAGNPCDSLVRSTYPFPTKCIKQNTQDDKGIILK